MKVLILGGSGFMATHFISLLTSLQIEYVSLSSSDLIGIDKDSGLLSESFVFPKGITSVVYFSQSPRFREVPQYASHVYSVNTLSAIRAAVASRDAGVTRFIYLSTGSVYGFTFSSITEQSAVRRDNWYSLSKLHAEEALSLFHPYMQVITVRPFGVYGPGQLNRLVPNLINSVRDSGIITLYSNPTNPLDLDGLKISLCYVDDASKFLLSLVLHGGPEVINLAGEESPSIRDIANCIASMLTLEPRFELVTQPRYTDLIADISRQRTILPGPLTDLYHGLDFMLQY